MLLRAHEDVRLITGGGENGGQAGDVRERVGVEAYLDINAESPAAIVFAVEGVADEALG